MECLFGITGKDFLLLAADKVSARSIVVMKSEEDKMRILDKKLALVYCGESGDAVNFAEYIQANIQLMSLQKDGIPLTTKAAANFTRKELAAALRSRVIHVFIA